MLTFIADPALIFCMPVIVGCITLAVGMTLRPLIARITSLRLARRAALLDANASL